MPMSGNLRDTDTENVPLRLLTFTTLYPNEAMPHHGIFVEQRLRQLLSRYPVTSRVVAPVPWFPLRSRVFGTYAAFAAVPKAERRHDISILHPRYPLLPRIGMSSAPLLMALAVYRTMKACLRDSTGFDVIDAHYFYPDGVAAALLGQWLAKPVTITARGTDVNLIPDYRLPCRWILWAAKRCSKIITVSDALRDRLTEIGVAANKIETLRNGVDLDLFRPRSDREELRRKLGMSGPTLLSVGHLIERKGHHIVIEALTALPGVNLVIVGSGPMQDKLAGLARKCNVHKRVTFAGILPQQELVKYYCAADALVLASSREGMANVLLEALACGTPVAATPYWGNPEVVADPRAGILTNGRTQHAIAEAVNELLQNAPDRAAVRQYAESMGWDRTSHGQLRIFGDATGTRSLRGFDPDGSWRRPLADDGD
jgi:glycosyltransferase involved in cell wall biosynthesis